MYKQLNTSLDEAQARIKIAGRNTNKLRYLDEITLMPEIVEEVKNLLVKIREESEKKLGYNSTFRK